MIEITDKTIGAVTGTILKDGWRGCCDAFPDGWPKGWLNKNKRDLKECNNGIKYEPKTEGRNGER